MRYLALAASAAEFEYTGKPTIVFDDHHPEYELDFHTGDVFTVRMEKNTAIIEHSEVPNEQFIAKFTDKKYIRLMAKSVATKFTFVPSAANPVYPHITRLDERTLELLYVYFNKELFNNACPPATKVIFSTKVTRRTKHKNAVGLAEYHSKGYRLSLDVKTAKGDPYLFVDILLHEMIHLYQHVQWSKTRDAAWFADDGHGATFVKEMERINRKGYNVQKTLDWEKRSTVTDDGIYTLVAELYREGQTDYITQWSASKLTVPDMNTLQATYAKLFPDCAITIKQYRTKDMQARALFLQCRDVKKLSRNIERYATGRDSSKSLEGRELILSTQQLDAATATPNAKFKLRAADIKYMVGTLPDYFDAISRHDVSDYGNPLAAWNNVPLGRINTAVVQELKDLHMQLKMGAKSRELERLASLIPLRYSGRVGHVEYRKSIRDLIAKHKLNGIENIRGLSL